MSGSVPLKISEIWALVLLKLKLGLEVWLVGSIFTIWPSILANCLLVKLLLYQSFNYEWVENLGLLVMELVIGAFS